MYYLFLLSGNLPGKSDRIEVMFHLNNPNVKAGETPKEFVDT
jgi:hypothetical protein